MNRNYVNLNVNPCKMCMPMGGSLAFKGIEQSMIIIHGSQGCSTYIRRHIAAHYNEPVDIASSSLSEEGTVYGGEKNLKLGIKNLVKLYNPKVIGVLTTCLAETIGDDIEGIVREIRKELHDIKADIIPVATPGYGGSQTEGYYMALKNILEYYSKPTTKNNSINIIVSNVTCEDIRELKKILSYFPIEYTIFPDITDVLDAPYTKNYKKLSSKGTKIEDIKKMSGAKATIEFGTLLNDNYSPGKYLENNYGVKLYRCPIPIGIDNTDEFINILCEVTNTIMPSKLNYERGLLLDAMIDSHKYNGIGRAAIYGDLELVYSISCLCIENGIKPVVVATGTKNSKFNDLLQNKLDINEFTGIILNDSDFDTIREYVKKNYANILIGNSDGKYIWEKDGIDLVRIGFPIHDNIGAQRRKTIGYKGSMELLDRITNTLLNNKHIQYRKNMYDLYYMKKLV